MKLKLTKIIFAIIASVLSLNLLGLTPVSATGDVCSSSASAEVKKAAGCSGNSNALPKAIQSILNAVILVAGLVSVTFIIIGGVHYMTSSGDAAKVKKARDTILYAVIGLIICALAFAIVNFVIGDILKQ